MEYWKIRKFKKISFVYNEKKDKKKLDSKILKLLKTSSAKLNFKEISDKLNLSTKKDLKILKKKLRNLKERGKLSSKLSKYGNVIKTNNKIKKGYLEIVRSGTGFLITPEDEKDIKINRRNLLNALHNDLVKVKLINKNGKISGEIIGVEKRDKIIHPVIIDEKNKVILKSGRRKVESIIKNKEDYSKIKGKRFTISIYKWRPSELKPIVVINQILGDIGSVDTEIKNIIIDNKIKNIFPKEVLKEAKMYDISLGDFVKAILKINNIIQELEKAAIIQENLDLLEKLKMIPELTLKSCITNQSLYL